MANLPLISVTCSTRNRVVWLKQALESVLRQRDAELELIVVDDHSTDETKGYLDYLANSDSRVRVITNPEQLGIAASANRSLNRARGQYIAKIDDDDYWIDDTKLKKQVAFLEEHPDYVVVGTGVRIVDEKGQSLRDLVRKETDRGIRAGMLAANRITNSTAVFRRDAALAVGGYDPRYRVASDYEFYLKLGRVGKMHNLPDICVAYRVSSGAITQTLSRAERFALHREYLKNYRHDYPHYYRALFIRTVRYLLGQ